MQGRKEIEGKENINTKYLGSSIYYGREVGNKRGGIMAGW